MEDLQDGFSTPKEVSGRYRSDAECSAARTERTFPTVFLNIVEK
jgi:hypothetical protein